MLAQGLRFLCFYRFLLLGLVACLVTMPDWACVYAIAFNMPMPPLQVFSPTDYS